MNRGPATRFVCAQAASFKAGVFLSDFETPARFAQSGEPPYVGRLSPHRGFAAPLRRWVVSVDAFCRQSRRRAVGKVGLASKRLDAETVIALQRSEGGQTL